MTEEKIDVVKEIRLKDRWYFKLLDKIGFVIITLATGILSVGFVLAMFFGPVLILSFLFKIAFNCIAGYFGFKKITFLVSLAIIFILYIVSGEFKKNIQVKVKNK
jgi:hypothetical protein